MSTDAPALAEAASWAQKRRSSLLLHAWTALVSPSVSMWTPIDCCSALASSCASSPCGRSRNSVSLMASSPALPPPHVSQKFKMALRAALIMAPSCVPSLSSPAAAAASPAASSRLGADAEGSPVLVDPSAAPAVFGVACSRSPAPCSARAPSRPSAAAVHTSCTIAAAWSSSAASIRPSP